MMYTLCFLLRDFKVDFVLLYPYENAAGSANDFYIKCQQTSFL